ncbi:hypothetical protein V1477_009679 [Vespula maculifrons]|uniref:Uncharacterized protein n=1 Tax=Vespula maculifrons TaxID=7453 RepID=A0ABD2CAH3_VESMC
MDIEKKRKEKINSTSQTIRSAILAHHKILTKRKYFRPRSHRVEVAASGDPRANGDFTLKSAIRDAFPLRELRASQQTGDIAPPSTPSASDISRHDRCPLEPQFVGATSAYSLFFASCPNHNYRTNSKFCDGSKTLDRDLGRN